MPTEGTRPGLRTLHLALRGMPVPLHRVPMPGTRATTLLLAFDAGARTERPEENGMAHFLEHLVFKGGEKFANHHAVNETAERMGGVLNAYTSHDLVAFHITVRAEAVGEALDLLTDFVGRPKLDAEDVDRERGVVIQEINRSKDQPSVVAEHLIDHAAFGEHPLGRPVLGPEEHLRSFSRDAIVAFRKRRWSRGAAIVAGNLEHLDHAFADMPVLQLGSGLESGKCGEAYRRMREIVAELHKDGPRPEEVDRARAYAAGRRILMYENTNAVARYSAAQLIVYDAPIDVEGAIRELDEVTYDEVVEAAASVDPETLAVACVGPHAPDEF